MKVQILPSAQEDLAEGFAFYEKQQAGLGAYFLDSLFADIDSLALYGGIHRKHHGEELAKKYATNAITAWRSNQSLSPALFSIYSVCYGGWVGLKIETPDGLKKLSNAWDVESRVNSAYEQYIKIIADNNGVKEANLKKLLCPLGVRINHELDSDWVAALNTFGASRGNAAHLSGRAANDPDPDAIRRQIWSVIIPGLRKLEKLLQSKITLGATIVIHRTFWERLKLIFS